MLQTYLHSQFPSSRRTQCELSGGVPTPRATRGPVLHVPSSALTLLAGLAVVVMSTFAPTIHASDLTVPNTFTAGTPALAAKVNANFSAVETAVDDNDARIAALQSLVNTMGLEIKALQNQHNSQQTAINAIQGSNVMSIDPYIRLVDIIDPNNGAPYVTVRLTGVNLQVVNGRGNTDTKNGLGNVILGYNELDGGSPPFERCSDGKYNTGPDCVFNGGVWAVNHRSGSHSLIVGKANSYASYGSLLAGQRNFANRYYASVLGGVNNTASGGGAVVSGGESNTADGRNSVVSGGHRNIASGVISTISGGSTNTATGTYSSVSGGSTRTVSGNADWRAGSLFEDH